MTDDDGFDGSEVIVYPMRSGRMVGGVVSDGYLRTAC
jgi:hypothetical protein